MPYSYTEADLHEAREEGIRLAAETIRDMMTMTAEEHVGCEHVFKDGAEAALREVCGLLPPGSSMLSKLFDEAPD